MFPFDDVIIQFRSQQNEIFIIFELWWNILLVKSNQNWKQQNAQPPVQNLIRYGDPRNNESAYGMISHIVLAN